MAAKVGKSITIDESLALDLRREALDRGVSFSELIEEKVKNPTPVSGGTSGKNYIETINNNNNIIMMYNNIIIVLSKQNEELLNLEFEKLEEEKIKLEQIKLNQQEKLVNQIELIEKNLPNKAKEELLNLDFNDTLNSFDKFRKIKAKFGLEISMSDLKRFKLLTEQARELKVNV